MLTDKKNIIKDVLDIFQAELCGRACSAAGRQSGKTHAPSIGLKSGIAAGLSGANIGGDC
jgi:hypothetical protein